MRLSVSTTAFAVLAAMLYSLFATAGARAGVDTEVPAPAKLRGSLAAGETEIVRFFAPAGALAQIKLGAKKSSGLRLELRLLDPAGDEVVIPSQNLTDKGASIKVKRLRLDRSGTWAVKITGVGAGDYKLVLKTKGPTRLVLDVVVGGDAALIPVAARFGSTIKVSAKAAGGSDVAPLLLSLDGSDLTASGKRSARSHKVSVRAAAAGDLMLRVGAAEGAGQVRVTVSIKPPKRKRARIDVTADALGRPDGGETAVGRVIRPGEGGVVAVDAGSDLVGAAIDVPAGALTEPTLISIRSAAAAALPDPENDAGAGPTVEFLPSGLQFTEPVTVTVPLDTSTMPVQTSAGDITVLIVEDDGSSTEVTPTSVDLDAGVCTVATSSFSRFTALAPAGSPPLGGRSYWGCELVMSLEDDFTGRDESGLRRVGRSEILLDFDPDGLTFTAEVSEHTLTFGSERDQDAQLQPVFRTTTTAAARDSGTWRYDADGRRIQLLSSQEEEATRLFVSRRGGALVTTIEEPDEGTPSEGLIGLLLERPATSDPAALVVGTYRVGVLSLAFDPGQPGESLFTEVLTSVGTLQFKASGAVDIDFDQRSAFGESRPSLPVVTFSEERDRGTATWSVGSSGAFVGAILVDPGEDEIVVLPSRDGQSILAIQRDETLQSWVFLVGIKQSSGRSLAELDGEYAGGTLFVSPREYQIENGAPGSGDVLFVPDVSVSASSDRLEFDGSSRALLTSRRSLYMERDPFMTGGIVRDLTSSSPETLQVQSRKDGRLAFVVEGDTLSGAVAADGALLFAVPGSGAAELTDFGFVLFVESPPLQPGPR